MKIRTVAVVCYASAAAGLMVLTFVGIDGWFRFVQAQSRHDIAKGLSDQVRQFAAAVEYVTTFGVDARILEGLESHALRLATDFRELGNTEAQRAASHLDQIAVMAGVVRSEGVAALAEMRDPLSLRQSGLTEATATLIAESETAMRSVLILTTSAFGAGTVMFGAVCLAGFAWVHLRIRRLGPIMRGVQVISEGNLDCHIDVEGRDEFALLADHLNGMAQARRQVEHLVNDREERFRQLAENITDVFWLSSPDKSRMLYVSPSYETIWGRPCSELYHDPSTWLHAIDPRDRPRVESAMRDQAEGTYRELYRVRRPNGSLRWIADKAFPVLDESGAVYRIAGLAQDVTRQVLAEEHLQERIKELNCLFAVQGLMIDSDGHPEAVLERIPGILAKSLRYDDVGVANLSVRDEIYLSPDWREPVVVEQAVIFEGDEPVGEVIIGYSEAPEPQSDRPRFIDEELELVRSIAALIGQMLERKQLADTVSRQHRLEAIGQLTDGIAHDFNNLLTVVLGYADSLREELPADSALQADVDAILQAARRGAELNRQLLAFARRQPLEPQPLDVGSHLRGLESFIRRILPEHIHIQFAVSQESWSTMIDPAQLESAVLNLALNARDAMPEGGHLSIEIDNVRLSGETAMFHSDLGSGDYVVVAVSDTGCGMTPDVAERVFEPFFTTKSSESEPGRSGSGMGLAMVYGFVKQSGGGISLYSEVDVGTTIKLYLPRATGDGFGPVKREEDKLVLPHRPLSVIVVEDDAMLRQVTTSHLELLGHEVKAAETAMEALEIIEAHGTADLLCSDVMLPGGMTGPELADEACRRLPGLAVLLMSGYTEEAVSRHGKQPLRYPLLAKPFGRLELARAVARALDRDGSNGKDHW